MLLIWELYRTEADRMFADYIDILHRHSLTRFNLAQRTTKANETAKNNPILFTNGLFLDALNTMFDAKYKCIALLISYLPEVIMLVLFFVCVAFIGIIGYSSGLSGKMITVPTILIALLISLIVFIIIDLD